MEKRLHAAALGLTLAVILAVFCWALPQTAQAAPRAAVFDFEYIDTSTEGEIYGKRADEQKRLILLGEVLRKTLAEKGLYEIVDITPAADAIARSPRLADCNGCAETIASSLNAEVAIIGYVQKVSNLILNINIEIRNVASGKLIKAASADIRSNTDESWLRGLTWIIKNRLAE